MHTITRGTAGESLAAEFLLTRGLLLKCRNYRCRLGEIDLVMFDTCSDSLVFVEVRYRRSQRFGGALASIDWRKQRKLLRTAARYMQVHGCVHEHARIDVIALGPVAAEPDRVYGNDVCCRYRSHQVYWRVNAVTAC